MKQLSILLVSALLSLAAVGCGDNLIEDPDVGELPSDRGTEVLIIPHQDQAITALESAEDLGYTDALLYEDLGVITAFGDLSLADKARDMPGIYEIMPREEGKPLPDYGVDAEAPPRQDTPDDLHGDSGDGYQPRVEPVEPQDPSLGGLSLHQTGPDDDSDSLYSPDEIIGGRR